MRAKALAVMAKAPAAGRVKTRLQPALDGDQAARLAKALLIDQLNHLCHVDSADLYLAFAPEEALPLMQELAPPVFTLFAQCGEDLGARMQAVFERLFFAGHQSVVLIGGDMAAVPLHFFNQAYRFLESRQHAVVLGPSRDGGYYLVGCNQPTPELFSGMSWSHDGVLAQTLAKLERLKIAHDLLPQWFDVDTPADVGALRAELDRPSLAEAMPQTVDFVRRLAKE